MKRWSGRGGKWLACALGACVLALGTGEAAGRELRLDVDPFYAESVLKGAFDGHPVYFFIGPSPLMEKAVVAFIESAEKTLDVCVFDLDMPEFADALLAAHSRGVKVRVLLHAPNAEKAYPILEQLKAMKAEGILTLVHNKSGLMHNKFMVADGETVWTGSYNLTRNGSRFNDNHVIVLDSAQLAYNYEREFQEILEGRHGRRLAYPTPYPRVTIGTVEVQNLFTPEDDVRAAMVGVIDGAKTELAIMAYSFTDGSMVEAIGRAVKRGVRVIIVLDTDMSSHPTAKTRELRATGASVRLSPGVLLHHKVIVADREKVVLGSANFSQAAFEKNDENVLIIRSAAFGGAMIRETQRVWRAEPYSVTKWRTRLPVSAGAER
ncbi:MAG: phosphatidylserine/phosphatidylglycerophosphate/cardiolipin synthase family protein [Kiritimatiellae bacterium]|nr:phosphatidylserine/phosphatidylglycerophosphate/cardiolipin synthase family protein [Kiritimatiellia bacterium]